MTFIAHYTRIVFQLLLVSLTKLFVLRGKHATPTMTLHTGAHLVAANHRAALDPFIIASSFSYKEFLHLAPFSFMTHNAFMQPLWLRYVAKAAGCFPAKPGLGPYGIDEAIARLERNESVVIFPEGRRIKNGVKSPARRGVGAIRTSVPHMPLLLVHVEWNSAYTVRYVHRSASISDHRLTDPELILQRIYKL